MDKYKSLIEEVKQSKMSNKKDPHMHWLLRHYAILLVQGTEKLIFPISNNSNEIIYYVHDNELFQILEDAHSQTGHGGRDRMYHNIKQKYKNITRDDILLFIHLCDKCQMKHKSEKKGVVSKPMIFNDFNLRCQIDLIDYQSHPDREFKFLMVYQDHLTKFVILRPLKRKTANEVVFHLMDIFTLFGAPVVLQSDNGREFCNNIIYELTQLWPNLKLVHGKPRHSQSQGSVERANQDVENMITTWMQDNNTDKWSDAVKFVQFMKNTVYHSGIKSTPYQAMFGTKARVGLKDSNLPPESYEDIETEEELEKIIQFETHLENDETRGQIEESENCSENQYIKVLSNIIINQGTSTENTQRDDENVSSFLHSTGTVTKLVTIAIIIWFFRFHYI